MASAMATRFLLAAALLAGAQAACDLSDLPNRFLNDKVLPAGRQGSHVIDWGIASEAAKRRDYDGVEKEEIK